MSALTDEQVELLCLAIQSISNGLAHSGPRGLEALSMAMTGEGEPGTNNLADALNNIGSEIGEVALALKEVAEALREK